MNILIKVQMVFSLLIWQANITLF